MNDTLIQWIGTGILALALMPLILFIVLYRFYSPWRADELGISLMIQKVSLLVVVIVVLAGNLLPDEFDFIRYISRVLAFGVVAVTLWLDVVNLRRVQTNSRKRLFFHSLTKRYPRR